MNFLITLAVVGQLIVQGPPKFPLGSGASSTLNDDLIAYWKLEETGSTTRADEQGSNDLTAYNAPSSGTGIISNGADFELSSSQYLAIADNTDLSLSTDTDFFISFWIKPESLSANAVIISKRSASGSGTEYSFSYIQTTGVRLTVGNGSGNKIVTTTDLTIGNWFHIVGWHDSTANTVNVRLDDTTTFSAAWADGTHNSTGDFSIGASSQATQHFDGIVDEVGFWKGRIPTASEITELYNSGSGKTCCPF